MSNIILTAYAQNYAEKATKEMIAQYNSGEYTETGKKELVTNHSMFALLHGYSLGKGEAEFKINQYDTLVQVILDDLAYAGNSSISVADFNTRLAKLRGVSDL